MIDDHNTNQLLLDEARNVASIFAGELPWTYGFIVAVDTVYPLITDANVALWELAISDGLLWSDLTCAIYLAIKSVGYVSAANQAAVVANICAIDYPFATIITALCDWCTALQLGDWRQLQLGSAMDVVDCSTCGDPSGGTAPWCFTFDFRYQAWTTAIQALNNAQYHANWDGTAWVCDGPGLGGQSWGKLQLANQADTSVVFNVSYFEIGYSRAVANTDGAVASACQFFQGATSRGVLLLEDTAVGGHVSSMSFAGGVGMDAIYVSLFADSGDLRVDYIRLRGQDGPSPWGASNCPP